MPPRLALVALLLLTACAPTRDADDDDASPGPDSWIPTSCDGVGTSDLPGVCIAYEEPSGTWTLAEAAAGIGVAYAVVVEEAVDEVVPIPQDAGGCDQPGASGLIVFESLGGGDQRYCLCDTGLCAGPSEQPVSIPAGATVQTFQWEGRNWWGPSDTGNPQGDPFPTGTYQLSVSAVGRVGSGTFEVWNLFDLTLVD